MNKKSVISFISLPLLVFLGIPFVHAAEVSHANQQPNIVVILTDDLGYGDVSHLNPESQIQTPHLAAMEAKLQAIER